MRALRRAVRRIYRVDGTIPKRSVIWTRIYTGQSLGASAIYSETIVEFKQCQRPSTTISLFFWLSEHLEFFSFCEISLKEIDL